MLFQHNIYKTVNDRDMHTHKDNINSVSYNSIVKTKVFPLISL